MRWILIAFLTVFSPGAALHLADAATVPEVLTPVPRGEFPAKNRCLFAVYGPELEAERGLLRERFDPPVRDGRVFWLAVKRANDKLLLYYCDSQST